MQLVAKLLGVESGQDACIRTQLYERGKEVVYPYGIAIDGSGNEWVGNYGNTITKVNSSGVAQGTYTTIAVGQGNGPQGASQQGMDCIAVD